MRHVVVMLGAVLACTVPDKYSTRDAANAGDDEQPTGAGVSDAGSPRPPVDAPVPSVDAAPPPDLECRQNGNSPPKCQVPHDECLDQFFLLDYTSAECVDGKCVYERRLVLCVGGCNNGSCS